MLSYEEWTKRLRKLVYSPVPAEIDQAREELQRDWRETQQRIAALEAQALTATLRAERLAGALREYLDWGRMTSTGRVIFHAKFTAALAASPDPAPLAQVAEALVHLRDDLSRWEAGTRAPGNYRAQIEDCREALRLLAELGVSDVEG